MSEPRVIGYGYRLIPRGDDVGGGWRLVLLADGEEQGGDIYPDVTAATDAAQRWLGSRPAPALDIDALERALGASVVEWVGLLDKAYAFVHGAGVDGETRVETQRKVAAARIIEIVHERVHELTGTGVEAAPSASRDALPEEFTRALGARLYATLEDYRRRQLEGADAAELRPLADRIVGELMARAREADAVAFEQRRR